MLTEEVPSPEFDWVGDMTGRFWLVRIQEPDKGRVAAIVFQCSDGHAASIRYAETITRGLWRGEILASDRFEYGEDVGLYVSADAARSAVAHRLAPEATPSTESEPISTSDVIIDRLIDDQDATPEDHEREVLAMGHDFGAIMKRLNDQIDRSTLPPAGSAWVYARDDSGWYVKASDGSPSVDGGWKRIIDYDDEIKP